MQKAIILLLPLLVTVSVSRGQTTRQLTLEQAIEMALANNKSIKGANLQKQYQQQAKASAGYIGKTEFGVQIGQYNSYQWGDNHFSVVQTIPNPKNASSQRVLGDAMIQTAENRKAVAVSELTRSIKQTYYQLMYLHGRQRLLLQQDSIYSDFVRSASLRYRTGETKQLELSTAQTQLDEMHNQLRQNEADIGSLGYVLQQLTGNTGEVSIGEDSLSERSFTLANDTAATNSNPYLAYLKGQVNVLQKERDVIAAQRLPDFTLGYFNQSLIGNTVDASGKLATGSNRFQGFNAGIALSIFNKPLKAKIKAAEVNRQIAENEVEYNQSLLTSQWQQAIQAYIKNKSNVTYYLTSALPNATLILQQAKKGYMQGDTGYTEYLLAIRNALQLRENYLQSLNQLNQSIIHLEYLAGNN